MATEDIVYHYCSLDTFHKIINSRSIRLAEVDKSNDRTELLWLRDHVRGEILKLFSEWSQKEPANAPSKELFNWCLEQALEYYFGDGKPFNFLVTCFSHEPDLLSQWRGYAADGCGVSIGFDQEMLKDLINVRKKTFETKFRSSNYRPVKPYGKVGYLTPYGGAKGQSPDWVTQNAQELMDDIAQMGVSDWANVSSSKLNALEKRMRKAVQKGFYRSAFYKSIGFKEEQEWRIQTLVLKPRGQGMERYADDLKTVTAVDCFVRNHRLVFYYDMPFEVANTDGDMQGLPQIIREVITGPKCAASAQDIFLLMRFNGLEIDFNAIRQSSISYR